MAEPVRERFRLGDEDLVRDRVAQSLGELRLGDLGDRTDQSVIRGATDDRDDAERALRGVGQRVDAREHDVAQRLGHASAQTFSAARSSSAKNAFPSERSNVSSTSSRRGGFAADGRDQLGDLVTVEAREIEAVRGTRTVELGEHRPERMAAVEVVGAERADDEARARRAGCAARNTRKSRVE